MSTSAGNHRSEGLQGSGVHSDWATTDRINGQEVFDRTIENRLDPTTEFYGTIREAFEQANQALWNGTLPSKVLFTVNVSRGAIGTFKHARWSCTDGNRADEIALHAGYLRAHKCQQFVMTLVHECCHLWQCHFGKSGKRGYHNKQFAAEMRRIGQEPINIGCGSGSDTGYRVTGRIIEGGATQRLYEALLAQGFDVRWAYAVRHAIPDLGIRAQSKKRKAQYLCQSCGLNAWAKPNAALICGACRIVMPAKEPVG